MKAGIPSSTLSADGGKRRDTQLVTIMLVDDQPIILRALRRVFRNEGYNILCASGADEALALLECAHCDLLITDYLMPEIDGIELIGKIKEKYPDLPCIMLTGHADFDIVSRAIRRGLLCKFALKPWSDNDLRKAVADALAATPRGCSAPPEDGTD